MSKKIWKKDFITNYMLRNALATLLVSLLAFFISLMNFYQCSLAQAFQRLFIYDTYTTLYFLLLWVFNYIVFETSKILYDAYEEKVTFIPCIVLAICAVMVFYLPILDLFQYNMFFLSLLICLRMIKEMWYRSPKLFTWLKKPLQRIQKHKENLKKKYLP